MKEGYFKFALNAFQLKFDTIWSDGRNERETTELKVIESNRTKIYSQP